MFTGLVQAVGRVVGVRPSSSGGLKLEIDPGSWAHRPRREESISVSGVCLTVANEPERAGGTLQFDVVEETIRRTTLGGLRPGANVNLEHALAVGGLLGGHVVQGHVDGIGVVQHLDQHGQWRLRIGGVQAERDYLAPKGSVTVDGVSLTIAATGGNKGWFEVALIPTTLERTTLGTLREGDRVNVEADAMVKAVVYWLREFGGAPPARG